MDISVIPASLDQKPIIGRLLELYQHDFSAFDNADLDANGLYGYRYLDHYWVEPTRFPFLVRVDDKLAGCVLVNHYTLLPDNQVAIAEFFVVRKYRRHGVGKRVAFHVFDRFPKRWEVAVLEQNHPAQLFWGRVVEEYTGGQWTETTLNDERWQGIVLSFKSRTARG